MLTHANLLRRQGELEEALQIMEVLEEMAPDEPVVLFNLAALMLQMKEPERARAYFDRIDPAKTTEELRSKLEELEEEIENAEEVFYLLSGPERLMQSFMEGQRREIEGKHLPVDAPLARGLKNVPAGWLEGACRVYRLEPAPRRREREKQLLDFLSGRENLAKAVEELEGEQRELLAYLLQQGGWSRLNAVTRKFGAMDGDGFYWEEQEPESPLGVLWSRALVMVGRANLAGRRCKIASIPLELREPLREILSGSTG
jgi:tetratricopeptide (TPR) repeat protein